MAIVWLVVILGGKTPGFGATPYPTLEACEVRRVPDQLMRGGTGSYCLPLSVPKPPSE